MDQWALWAHELAAPPAASRLNPAAVQLGRLLATAGFEVQVPGKTLAIARLRLGDDPPTGAAIFPLDLKPTAKGKSGRPKRGKSKNGRSKRREPLTALYDRLDAVSPDGLTVLEFDPRLEDAPPDDRPAVKRQLRIPFPLRWLPLLPAADRPGTLGPDGRIHPHELTDCLRRVVRAARERASEARAEARLRFAVRRLIWTAYAQAVGGTATGRFGSKYALLRRAVLGGLVAGSCRAVISPGGPLNLAVDEIGLPPRLAQLLLSPEGTHTADRPGPDGQALRVWLKRDPVLHRWGLLSVRVRLVEGSTVRLPASLLGPLGADFDGDTVALFARLPGQPGATPVLGLGKLAWHPLLQKAMLAPGKQYRYGLHRLTEDPRRLADLQDALRKAGAPRWLTGKPVKDSLAGWVRAASAKEARGEWGAIIESHALAALAENPGMDFGLTSVAELKKLPVVTSGAAKDLYEKGKAQEAARRILAGNSLDVYRSTAGTATADDPIAEVMVAARVSVGRFGGALRRLLYTAGTLRPADVRDAQCLTEQVTQKALSVKAGRPPLDFAKFNRQLKRLLQGLPWKLSDSSELRSTLEPLEQVWKRLRKIMPKQPPAWLKCLRQPHELEGSVDGAPGRVLRVPLGDLRLRCWFDQSGSGGK